MPALVSFAPWEAAIVAACPVGFGLLVAWLGERPPREERRARRRRSRSERRLVRRQRAW